MGSLPPLMMVDILSNEFYSLAENKVVNLGHSGADAVAEDGGAMVVGSSHGWLALLNQPNFNFFLWNPISDERVNLPSLEKLPLPNKLMKVWKVIVSSSSGGEEWRAVMIYGPVSYLAFCCPRQSNSEWTTIGDIQSCNGENRVYQDCAYSGRLNRLFCSTECKSLERCDLRDPLLPRIDCSNEDEDEDEDEDPTNFYDDSKNMNHWQKNYMVVAEQLNELFVVVRKYMCVSNKKRVFSNMRKVSNMNWNELEKIDNDPNTFKTIGFHVHKFVMEGTKMRESYMDRGSLNGLAIFVGMNHSFALLAADYPGLKPDSIYFTDLDFVHFTCTSSDSYGYGGNEVGIFNYQNRTFYPCYFPSYHVNAITKITPLPVWFTPSKI